jgi:hypothetical protein
MIISRKNKFIFISIPKTGTTSVESSLQHLKTIPLSREILPHSSERRYCLNVGATVDYSPYLSWIGPERKMIPKHITLKELKKNCIDSLDNYFSFTFVRNPWERELSAYFYRIKMVKYWKESAIKKSSKWYDVYKNYSNSLSRCNTFSDWIADKAYMENTQLSWAKDVSFIGRFENLQDDFDIICDKIGIPRQKLPHKNKSQHKHYTKYYDDETKQIVAEKYAKDIEYFGYKFGE